MSKMWVSFVHKTTFSNGDQDADQKNGFGILELNLIMMIQIEQLIFNASAMPV